MFSTFSILSLAIAFVSSVDAHMTIWSKSMYGVGPNFEYVVPGQPCDPLGPDWDNQTDWWFRGPAYRALPPQNGSVTELVAGGQVTFEISCHVAWTSFGTRTTTPGSLLDACPENPGAFHSGDPANTTIDDTLLSGCALAIADVDDINDVTMDNLVIFSVQSQCVKQKVTSFEVPAALPGCTGKKCICGWLANNGTGNFYMTAFDCSVTPSPSDTLAISYPLTDPYFCGSTPNATCLEQQQTVAKRPMYAYNEPSNVPWIGNNDRAGYHEKWGWKDGAQNGIFEDDVTVPSGGGGGGVSTKPPRSSRTTHTRSATIRPTKSRTNVHHRPSSSSSTKPTETKKSHHSTSTKRHHHPHSTTTRSHHSKFTSKHHPSTTKKHHATSTKKHHAAPTKKHHATSTKKHHATSTKKHHATSTTRKSQHTVKKAKHVHHTHIRPSRTRQSITKPTKRRMNQK